MAHNSGSGSLWVVSEGVLDGLLVPGRERTELVDELERAHRRLVEAGRAAGGLHSDVGGRAIAVDVEDQLDALAHGTARVDIVCVPILVDSALHGVKIPGITLTKDMILNSERSLTIAVLSDGL